MIEFKNINIGYEKALLENVNINHQGSGLISLIGLNGTGKTTLFKTISGLIPPLSGDFLVDSQSLIELPIRERARIVAAVFTFNHRPMYMNVMEFVALGRTPYLGWNTSDSENQNTQTDKAIRQCGLEGLASRALSELSDGEFQKACLSRALAQQTPLMLFDEPTAHLDVLNSAAIWKLFKALTTIEGRCIMVSTHDIQKALKNSDYIWFIHDGKLITGDVESIMKEKAFSDLAAM